MIKWRSHQLQNALMGVLFLRHCGCRTKDPRILRARGATKGVFRFIGSERVISSMVNRKGQLRTNKEMIQNNGVVYNSTHTHTHKYIYIYILIYNDNNIAICITFTCFNSRSHNKRSTYRRHFLFIFLKNNARCILKISKRKHCSSFLHQTCINPYACN